MKISLIVPPFNLLKEGYGIKTKLKRGNLPNLGICIIASCLEKENHSVQIIDAEALLLTNEQILRRVKGSDIIGITITNAHYEVAKTLIRKLKDFEGIVIVGGPHAVCFPDKIMDENPRIDFLVMGEGEETIVELINALEKNYSPRAIKGVFYRDNNQICSSPPRQPIKNLDTIPRPALHLLDLKLYSPLPDQYKKLPATSWITSRGCTWRKCTFCFQAGVNAQPYRRHSPERIIDDIEWLQKEYGINEIDFLDDEFFINELWVEKFCNLLQERHMELSWTAYGRADHVTKKMLEDAEKVGCWGLYMGLESGNQDLLNTVNKGITLEQVRQVCKWCHELGLEIRGSFMLGLPGETPEKAQNTIDFAKELGLSTAAFHLTHPEHGTKLYDVAVQQGRILNKEDWTKRTKVAYLPDGYENTAQLEKIQKRAFRQFYFRPSYIFKRFLKIKNIQDLKREVEGFKFLLGII